jgi:hypothetical protein
MENAQRSWSLKEEKLEELSILAIACWTCSWLKASRRPGMQGKPDNAENACGQRWDRINTP